MIKIERDPTEMEKRVAARLSKAYFGQGEITDWGLYLARVAIREMREPTMDMICDGSGESLSGGMDDIYQAMIDSASPAENA